MVETVDIVTGLNVYPLKSAQAATVNGLAVNELSVSLTGFEAYGVRDRDFVIVEAETLDDGSHLFVSQRGWGSQGRVDRAVNRDADRLLATVQTDISEQWLTMSSLVGTLQLAANYEESPSEQYGVRVHSGKLERAIDQGSSAADYFSTLLGRAVRVARANRKSSRLIELAGRRHLDANRVAAADGYPFLLVSEASLAESHQATDFAPGSVPIDRYRGNIVIAGDGIGAWGEDYVREAMIGDMLVRVVKACSRCPIPNIDQQTGERGGAGGLKVLRGHSGTRFGDDRPQPLFGQNLNHRYAAGLRIAIGNELRVVTHAAEPNFLPSV